MASYNGDSLNGPVQEVLGAKWQDILAEAIFNESGDMALKGWFFGAGWNDGLIDKMTKLSHDDPNMSMEETAQYIAANAGVSQQTAMVFLQKVSSYVGHDIKPLISTVADSVKEVIDAIGKTAEGAPKLANSLPVVLIILAVGVGGYLVFAGRKGTKLTPF